MLAGNPRDETQLEPSLSNHRRLFGKPPDLVAADWGVHSAANERMAQEAGIKWVCLPKPGHKSP